MSRNSTVSLAFATTTLAFIVVVLGAFVRLSDAGLSCPDWPGCYGQIIAPTEHHEVAAANEAFPDSPVVVAKAWKEMVHRYLAGALGLAILTLAFLALRGRKDLSIPVSCTLVALVIFQAALGMWTVTLMLRPAIVTAHLLGGFTTLALLWWLAMGTIAQSPARDYSPFAYWLAVSAMLVVSMQVALGGWTSANYAALACPDFPTCHGDYWPPMDRVQGFNLWRELGRDAEGNLLSAAAMTAIHWIHRLGALVTAIVVSVLVIVMPRSARSAVKWTAMATFSLLLTQIILGISTVLTARPLALAVAHTAVGALLVLSVTTALFVARKTTHPVSEGTPIGVQSAPFTQT